MSFVTSHDLARELLNRPDGFITITIEDKECVISKIQRKSSHGNLDDTSTYYTLVGERECDGNIKR